MNEEITATPPGPQFESSSPFGPIQRYGSDLWTLLTQPTRFFRGLPAEGGLTGALTFALVTHWLGAALSYVWASLIGQKVGRSLEGLMKMAGDVANVDSPGNGAILIQTRDRLVHWIWGTGSILLDPFLTLGGLLFTAFFVWIGAKLLVTPSINGAPTRISYESALRILCFGMAPAILAGIPLVGGFVSSLCILIVTVIGAREIYRVSTTRATIVVLFPKLLLLGIILVGVLFLGIALFKIASGLL